MNVDFKDLQHILINDGQYSNIRRLRVSQEMQI